MPKYPDYFRRYLQMPKAPAHKIRSLFTRKRVMIGGGLLAAFLLITPIATYAYYARDINDRSRLMNHNNTGIELKDRNGQVFYSYGHMGGGDVPLNQISPNLQHALIASEDKDFYHNNGVSLRGMARALYGDVVNADPTRYGGSTITQQLVKNKLLTSNKNFLRKYQELSMAIAVDRHYSKDDILDMYLNSVYFGEGSFGIKDASKTYFNTTPDKLTAAQSAMLVGILPAPSAYSPISGSKTQAVREQHRVLDKMQQNGYISASNKKAAEASELQYADASSIQTNDHAQHFAQMVVDQLTKKYGEERINRSGFEVTTSLDLNSQEQAEAIVKKRVATFVDNGGNNAALVAMDPKTGFVRALVGSVDWNNPQFGQVNMAVMPRQPGSSFKPIYYSYALDKHLITTGTILHDSPTTFGDWTPHDVDNQYRGNVTVRQALAQSMNIPAAEVMQKVTPEAAAKTAQELGISTITQPEKYGLTLAVGTAEAKLNEMTEAYATFANSGAQMPAVMVTNIQDKYGSTIFKYKSPKPKQLRSPEAAFVLTSILDDNAARAPLYGSSLNIPGHTVAVKTGTTDDNVDAWTIGYTPSLTVGVWVGNNEHHPMQGLAGGSSAGLIWRDTMEAYVGNSPNEAFAQPSGVRQIATCSGVTDYFISGTEPGCTANAHVASQPERKSEDNSDEAKPEDNNADAKDNNDQSDSTDPAQTETANTGNANDPTGGRGGGDSGGTTTPPSGGTTPPPGGTTPPPSGGGTNPPPPPPGNGGGDTTPPGQQRPKPNQQ
jgi:1A family penicillin-binding protein